ncbi:MAG: hypothetical protein JNK05_39000 [Myxococcales bacterium]|nr:hypothetical protein [Myxococcales bacterium]
MLAVALVGAAVSCSSGTPPSTRGAITGRIFVVGSTTLVGGAVVTLSDGQSTRANESGWFFLQDLAPVERTVVTVVQNGYIEALEPVIVRAGAVSHVDVYMVRGGVARTVAAATGGEVSDGAGASATFPPGAFVRPDGQAASGDVTVTVVAIDPTDREQIRAFPGDFSARRTNGSATLLETFVPMAITARQGDAVLGLAPGVNVAVTFPIPASLAATAPSNIELWSLNPSTGAWVEEGTAARQPDATAPSGAVYRASISHLSWWNCDRPISETTCVRGCVRTPDGRNVPNVHVNASGVDYRGESDGTTGADGCFALDVKLSSRVAVVATTAGLVSEPQTITASSTPMSAALGAARCQDIGTLLLTPPLAQFVLQWGEAPADLDSHTTGPGETERFHISYSNRGTLTATPYCSLDTDDTSSFGPEITTITRAPSGVYRFSVHNYSSQSQGAIERSSATVMLVLPRQGLIRRYAVPTANPANLDVWRVFDLQANGSGDFSVRDVNGFAASSDGYNP